MKRAAFILFFCWIFVVLAFVFLVSFAGGDAINGKVEASRYYVGQHSRYTEVSRGLYMLLAADAGLLAVGLPFVFFFVVWPSVLGFKMWRKDTIGYLRHPILLVGMLIASVGGVGLCLASLRCIRKALEGQ